MRLCMLLVWLMGKDYVLTDSLVAFERCSFRIFARDGFRGGIRFPLMGNISSMGFRSVDLI